MDSLSKFGDLEIVTVACGLVLNSKREVLLIQRSKTDPSWPNMWEPPRGKIRAGETIIDGLKREVKEETGLSIDPVKYVDQFQYVRSDGKRISIQYNFLCRMVDTNQQVVLSFEHQNYKWVSKVGILELMVSGPEVLNSISKVLHDDTAWSQFYSVDNIAEFAVDCKNGVVDCILV